MSEPENFLERWSRKKREAAEPSPEPEAGEKADASPAPATETGQPVDLESLPSLDSISADTDMREFLRPGVPDDLRHEALRRAWAADPGVRDFVELLENGWDFNDPNAMVGFGSIEPSEVARLMAQFDLTPREKKVVAVEDDRESSTEPAGEAAAERDEVAVPSDRAVDDRDNAAPQDESDRPGRTTSPPVKPS